MTGLKYVGRAPDADFSVVHKYYVDTRYTTIKVDDNYVSTTTAARAAADELITPAYVDSQDALLAHKTAVDAADTNYLAASIKGQANGVAGLDASTFLLSGNLPTVQTERKPTYAQGSIIGSGNQTVTTVGTKGYKAGTLSIPDPGFPYVPLIFVTMQAGATGASQSDPTLGTTSYGQISVLRNSDDLKYSWCLCTSAITLEYYTAVPFADTTVTPITRPPLTGATNFDLWVGLWNGATYTYNLTGVNFFALAMPGV